MTESRGRNSIRTLGIGLAAYFPTMMIVSVALSGLTEWHLLKEILIYSVIASVQCRGDPSIVDYLCGMNCFAGLSIMRPS